MKTAEEYHTDCYLPKGESWTDRDAFLFAQAYKDYCINSITDEMIQISTTDAINSNERMGRLQGIRWFKQKLLNL